MAEKGVNKVILIGKLGQDPEIRYMPNGNAVASLSIATSETWKDRNSGQVQEKTEWHKVVIFGKLAEIAGEYLRKGSQVYIEGKLRTRKWQDQQGQDRYTTEVVVDMTGSMQMLDRKPQDQQGQGGGYQPQGQSAPQNNYAQATGGASNRQPQRNQNQPPQHSEPPMDFDDDIPFAPVGLQYPSLLLSM